MGSIVSYSILRYSPAIISGEAINLGVIFTTNDGYKEFRHTNNFARIKKFDDEINIDNLKKFLDGMTFDVSDSLFSHDGFNIREFTKFYVNLYTFSEIISVECDDYRTQMDEIFKSYFRFDFKKKDRPKISDDRRLVQKIIDNAGVAYKKDVYIDGSYNDRVKYDYVTDKCCIKIFDFENKDIAKVMQSVKAHAWNCSYNRNNHDQLVLYRYSSDNCNCVDAIQSIKRIFHDSGAKVAEIDKLDLMLLN